MSTQPARLRSQRPALLVSLVCALPVFLATLLPPPAAVAVGLTYLPGTAAEEVAGSPPSLAVLTWQLPGGTLVADRLAPGRENRFGTPFPAASTGSEWFLIRPQHHHDPYPGSPEPQAATTSLARFGKIHLADRDCFVVEVPADNVEAFVLAFRDLTRIPLTPAPPGWDRTGRAGPPAAASTTRDEAMVLDFVDGVNQAAYFEMLQQISGAATFWHDGSSHTVTTRYYNTAQKDLVAEYLAARLQSYGYTVEFDDFLFNEHPCRNVVASKLGTTVPDEYVIVGGHYDSTSPQGPTLAPGAEDNASGACLVMEIARIAAERDFERSVQFVLFDSEEQGLNGSYHFVNEAVSDGRNLVAAITADMITWYQFNYGVRIEGETPWEWLMSIMEENVNTFTDISNRKDYYSWGSDHVPFQQAGIAAFLAIDWDWNTYPYYHGIGDTWDRIAATAHIGVQITRACAATLADVAILQPDLIGVGEPPPVADTRLSAFPNPFNPQVTITFFLAAAGPAELAVFDLAGRRLSVLAAGFLEAGPQSVTWRGQDRKGEFLGSGTYLCRLKTARTTTCVKLNLVR